MSDDDAEVIYDDSGYPNVHYSKDEPAIIQAVGTFIAQVGKLPPNHPIVAPAVEWLQAIKPPSLRAVRGGKD
jgi:hypothetical protein